MAGEMRALTVGQPWASAITHSACDGEGRILARWPRSSVERYWQPGECEGHDHQGAREEAAKAAGTEN